jgi:outer membrane immunogenic protein
LISARFQPRELILSSLIVFGFISPAAAADLPPSSPAYAPPNLPIFTWTGIYLGGDLGYAFGVSSKSLSYLGSYYGSSAWPDGVIGGAHIGYNYQFPAITGGTNVVLGLEGDVEGSSYGKSWYDRYGNSYTTSIPVQGSTRGRLGLAFDRALLYITGGAVFGGFDNQFALPNGLSTESTHTRVGWTIGGGIEYALTPNWSLRGEYRYSDFGKVSDDIYYATSTGGGSLYNQNHETEHAIRAGFSYKFSQPWP